MIELGVIVGEIKELGTASSHFLNHCRRAQYYRDLEDFFQNCDQFPQLILIHQQWSDEYRPASIERLLEQFQLSRVICSLGHWSASDRRTRNYWPQAICVPVKDVHKRIDAEIQVVLGQRPPLERTAGLDEVYEFDQFPSRTKSK